MNTFKDVEKDEEEPKRFWRSSMDPALKDVKKDDEEPKPALKDDKKTVIHGDEVISVRWDGDDDFNIYKCLHTNKEEGVTTVVYTPPYQSIGGNIGVASAPPMDDDIKCA
jgi:hypothetical protein